MARRNFLERNINGQVATDNGAPSGNYTVVVICFIGIDGKITEAVPETSHGYGMEKEVIRIIKAGPAWIPAIQYGRKVNAYRRQPVTFAVDEK